MIYQTRLTDNLITLKDPVGTKREVGNDEYIMCKFEADQAINAAVTYDSAYEAAGLTTTLGGDYRQVGRVNAAVVASASIPSYAWVQIRGVGDFLVADTVAALVDLQTTAVAGVLDDASTAKVMSLVAAAGRTGAGAVSCQFMYPYTV